jgi:hypothetical protein
MGELKRLSKEAIPAALEKAMRYRLLNEPLEAESICLDVLVIEPENHEALVTLFLTLTDQLQHNLGERVRQAKELLPRLGSEYDRSYYHGILCERQAKVHLRRETPGSANQAYRWFKQAMEHYEEAMEVSPSDNNDAILRWNTCIRILARHPELMPEQEPTVPQFLE